MRKISIIGIGVGDPDHLTLQAVAALNTLDVVFIPDKGADKAELRQVRETICARHMRAKPYRIVPIEALRRRPEFADYRDNVVEWHGRIVAQYERLIGTEMRDGQHGGFLVWGDPGLYDSTLRIIEQVKAKVAAPLEFEVIPGISSVQVLAARHRIPLNGIGNPVEITTGRRLAEAVATGAESVVVMLDGELALMSLDGRQFDVFWGAYLGTEDEILIAGQLSDVNERIAQVRAEARARKGWIMDTYLLRRRHAS